MLAALAPILEVFKLTNLFARNLLIPQNIAWGVELIFISLTFGLR